GRGKAVLVYPAERMNNVTANTLLKTLEEPPGDVKFVLASEASHQLLPTIRSRCLGHAMAWPDEAQSLAWLEQQGVKADDAPALLRAAGGRPEDALQFSQTGRDAKVWSLLPKAAARGDAAAIAGWTPGQAVDALQKVCHDLLAVNAGAQPRFFTAAELPAARSIQALSEWSRELARTARTVEHPFNTGLMLEALVSQARIALNSRP
ncbi:MAG: DNA polymerase III subunit delta', partial [Ramlibacter sp.]